MAKTFKQLGVSSDLIEGVAALGIVDPTPVQEQAIDYLLADGGDLIAQAQTGTGKTAAFGLPLLMRIDDQSPVIQGLVIAPTRELAKQIGKQLFRYTKFSEKKIFIEVTGGGDKIDRQVERLTRPTHIVVATPGRLLDLLKMKALSLADVEYLVLDEADEMLSMGFQKELAKIFRLTEQRRATWLFSATFQKRIQDLVEEFMQPNAQRIKVDQAVVNANIEHQFVICDRNDKDEYIARFLKSRGNERGLIFARTRLGAIRLGKELTQKGLSVAVIQGDLSQRERDKVMRAFKKERIQFLIATDVAARGIDVEGLSFVIQRQLPDSVPYYAHRSGRTARAGKRGLSLCLIEPGDREQIEVLERELDVTFKEVH